MPEELGFTIQNLINIKKTVFGDLEIFTGRWNESSPNGDEIYLSLAWSGWGKVSSARAATRLISIRHNEIPVEALFFTGVAGAISSELSQWDIVIPNQLIQYDMDARPLYKRFVIPALNIDKIKIEKNILIWTVKTIKNSKEVGILNDFGNIHEGLVGTGDCFISDQKVVKKLKDDIDDLLAVEMEGASVAQVAKQENIPFQIVRIISDGANDASEEDFSKFLSKYNQKSALIITQLVNNLKTAPF